MLKRPEIQSIFKLLLFCGLGAYVFAQTNTSTIAGVITDPSGGIVPDATVTITDAANGQVHTTRSSSSGDYAVPQLPPGRYDIRVEAKGFATAVSSNVTLDIAQRARVDVSLQVGSTTSTIEVGAQAEVLDTDTASLGQTISSKPIEDLPLNGRNYLTLGSLSPGVLPQIPNSQAGSGANQSFVAQTTERPDRSIYVGGQRESSTSYLYDGAELRNPRVGETSISPSLDAVQEFKIQRNFFQAEFGNSPGIINVASRSGTNQWHGTAFEYVRNDFFDAKNFFSPVVEPFKRNQFGGSLGAPILKDKLFFFLNYEGIRQHLGQVQRILVPEPALLAGNFAGQPTIYDPTTYNAATQSRTPFPGNQIPSNRFNQVALNYMKYIPAPNGPLVQGANLVGTPTQTLNDDQDNVRVDYVINSKNSLFARQSWENAPLTPASLVPLGGQLVSESGENELLQLTSTVSPATVNVFRAYHNYANLFGTQIPTPTNLAAQLGFTGLSSSPLNYGLPDVSLTGYAGFGGSGLTQGNKLNNYDLTDSFSWIKGTHSLKFGAEVRQSRMLLDSDNGARGSFGFNATWTAALNPATGLPAPDSGNSVADYLLGYPTSASGAVGTSLTHFRYYTTNLYAQDDWKLTPSLTLNLGLRYEFVTPPTAEDADLSHISGFSFATGKQLFPVLGQIRNSIVNADHANFAPRLGLAYNPGWARSWTIRAGAGIYYDQTQLNETQFTTNSPPTYGQQSYNYTGGGLPPSQLGVNVLPVTAPAPITPQYQTPPGTLLFEEDTAGKTPREYMWTASIQKSFASNWLLESAYVGTAGRFLSKRYNADSDTVPGVLYSAVPGTIRFPNLTGILYSSKGGSSSYNAFETKLEKRFTSGWNLLSSYTYSHSIDNDSGDASGTPNLNPSNFQLDRGSSAFDVRHRWVTSVLYELPVGKGKQFLGSAPAWQDAFWGGWQVNFITTYMSGLSTTVTSPDLSGVVFIAQRANATGINPGSDFSLNGQTISPGNGFGGQNRGLYWINPGSFAETGPLQLGTSGRNVITGPGSWNTDLSMFKQFRLYERAALTLRGEFFNVFNNVRFDSPNLDTSSPAFGTLVSAEPARIIQVALRLQF
ncbi:MAG TPA: TonB-dependent receptor [Bryobacteraceae bacterium]|nr:TonB-dependent receptor [Bryobacteraceae bacterium]